MKLAFCFLAGQIEHRVTAWRNVPKIAHVATRLIAQTHQHFIGTHGRFAKTLADFARNFRFSKVFPPDHVGGTRRIPSRQRRLGSIEGF